jgi:hypothetical protein
MSTIQICNTFFEWELEQTHPTISLEEAFLQTPIYRQLQFLPMLYGDSINKVFLTEKPEEDYSDHLKKLGISSLPKPLSGIHPLDTIESWGPSRIIQAFARRHRLSYIIPDWEVVRTVNSKQFSFQIAPKLPHAQLLHDRGEALKWFDSFEGIKVLKTCYGLSGRGHKILDAGQLCFEEVFAFLEKEWKKGLPVIAEPWVDRLLDFSTQWAIDAYQKIAYVGVTLCENDSRGQYRSNTIGEDAILFKEHLPFLCKHKAIALPILSQMAREGFFGNVGIDAMLYTLPSRPNEPLLHPVVEINARKTMGWAALMFTQRHCPGKVVKFAFTQTEKGYLPSAVIAKNGKTYPFRRNLEISFV